MESGESGKEQAALRVIVYVSRRNMASSDDVIRMLLRADQKNWHSKITGAIWFGENHFFQVLEGSPDVIDPLYDLIKADGRHIDVITLHHNLAKFRAFDAWDTHVFDGDEDAAIVKLTQRYVINAADMWNPHSA